MLLDMHQDVPMVPVQFHWDVLTEIEPVPSGHPDAFLTTSAFQRKTHISST